MNLYPKNIISIARVKKFMVIFYLVGILGFIIPLTKSLFVAITPLALLLNTYLLAVYHSKYFIKDVLLFLLLIFIGFTIELIGVNTGLIFGRYVYGETLGYKFFNTPVIIGLNWLFLSYSAISVSKQINKRKYIVWLLAPSIMVVYDWVLEKVAPKMDMWSWHLGSVPSSNYITWFIVSLFFVGILEKYKVDTHNPLALILFICQFLFFLILSFVL